MLSSLADPFLSILYPHECRVCGGEVESLSDGVACSDCWAATRIFTGNETLCTKCGAFLFEGGRTGGALCRKCNDQSFDGAIAVGLYEKALAASVLSLKRSPRLFGRVKGLLAEIAWQVPTREAALVIPVPLSPRRLRERGFNQAAVLAKAVAKELVLDLDDSSLIRKVDTPMHRAGMDRKARGITVKNAFDVVRPKLIEGRDVLLVDDVLTSGETVSSCAAILKKKGAARVDVMTLARAA